MRTSLSNQIPDHHCGSHRDRRFVDHYQWPYHGSSNLGRHRPDRRQVAGSVLPLGSTHCDEDYLCFCDGTLEIGGKGQPSGLGVARHQLFEPRLVNWNVAFLEALNFGRISIDAGHIVAAF